MQRAYGHALEAVQILEELGARQTLDDCLSRLAMVEAVLGRESDSHSHAQRALESALSLGDRKNEVRARSALGMLALATGDADEAVTQLAPTVAALEAGGFRNPNQFRIHPDLVEAYARLRRAGEARPIAASLERQAHATRVRWTLGVAMRCRALVADGTLRPRPRSTRRYASMKTRACSSEPEPSLLRGAPPAPRSPTQRTRCLGAALEAFEATGAAPWEERARAELRASGLTLRRREPAAPDRLTPQELQVARLVAEGKSNRDVATTLFITPKTVEFHLTRVYRKLEIHSRSQLPRLMADSEIEGGAGAVP